MLLGPVAPGEAAGIADGLYVRPRSRGSCLARGVGVTVRSPTRPLDGHRAGGVVAPPDGPSPSCTPFDAPTPNRAMLERNERPWGEMLAALPLGSGVAGVGEGRVIGTVALVVCLLGAISPPVAAWASPTRLDDADVVVVLPSASRGEADQRKELLGPWAGGAGEH